MQQMKNLQRPEESDLQESPGLAGAGESMPQIAKNIEGATTLRTFQQNSSSAFRNSTEGNRTEITNSMLTSNGPGHLFTEQQNTVLKHEEYNTKETNIKLLQIMGQQSSQTFSQRESLLQLASESLS